MSAALVAEEEPIAPPAFKIETLLKGTVLYKQTQKPLLLPLVGHHWFSFEYNYGTSYGPYISKFVLTRDVQLLDVAKTKCRDAVSEYAERNELAREKIVNRICFKTGSVIKQTVRRPLDHAWGEGECAEEAAITVCAVAARFALDGWIAREWDEENLEGPEEVMLCVGDESKPAPLSKV